jgi:hypothetical protein
LEDRDEIREVFPRVTYPVERREFGLGALRDGVGAAERIRQRFVAEVMFGCG